MGRRRNANQNDDDALDEASSSGVYDDVARGGILLSFDLMSEVSEITSPKELQDAAIRMTTCGGALSPTSWRQLPAMEVFRRAVSDCRQDASNVRGAMERRCGGRRCEQPLEDVAEEQCSKSAKGESSSSLGDGGREKGVTKPPSTTIEWANEMLRHCRVSASSTTDVDDEKEDDKRGGEDNDENDDDNDDNGNNDIRESACGAADAVFDEGHVDMTSTLESLRPYASDTGDEVTYLTAMKSNLSPINECTEDSETRLTELTCK